MKSRAGQDTGRTRKGRSTRARQQRASGAGVTSDGLVLSERQKMVLRAVVAAYVADAAPASSSTVSHLLPVGLSTASIRNTMADLAELGLLEKPHASAGRVPTARGLREFIDRLIDVPSLGAYERRSLAYRLEEAADRESLMHAASRLLSERTNQLGFALTPSLERLVLRHISLVRVATDRLMVVVVPKVGPVQQRVIHEEGHGDQAELDRMAALINQRVAGRNIGELRSLLEAELRELVRRANRLMARTLALGLRVLSITQAQSDDLVIATRLALLSQPEFNDPDRIRGLFRAVETNERLLEVLRRLIDGAGDMVSVSLGDELEEPALRDCAVIAVPYGSGGARSTVGSGGPGAAEGEAASPLGVVGVIGPRRMDYARIIPLVSYCSQLVTEKLAP